MIKKVYENIYMFELALPNNPLKAINIYVIKDGHRGLVIDTGFNMKECREGLLNAFEEMKLDISNLDLFITHHHADHSGLADMFQEAGSKVYAGEIDGRLVNDLTDSKYWTKFEEQKIVLDLVRDNVVFEEHPAYEYCTKDIIDFDYVSEGRGIQVGEYFFEVIDIPGHTPGHVGLYERKHKLFFGGDHILDKITPNIAFWGFEENILGTYLNSLAKIYEYEIDYLFPSHRNVIRDHHRRINELMGHHKERLNEIVKILEGREFTARDVAAQMSWRIRAKSWEDFPIPQKWFAAGEAMSHLEHLYWVGKASRDIKDEKMYYKLK